jgi:hypothetical protein
MKKRHVLLILIGFIPLAAVILLFVFDFLWGWLFRLTH